MKNNFIFIGPVGIKKNIIGGAVSKNKCLLKFLQSISTVNIIDTTNWKIEKLKIFIEILIKVIRKKSESIIISTSSESAYKLLKFIFKINFFQKKIFYFVIGGKLPEQIKNNILKKEVYMKIDKIFIESKLMKEELINLGITQTEYLPNFKDFNIRELPKINKNKKLKCIFFSRILPEKGTEMIFEMLKSVEDSIEVDFYGPIEEKYKEIFYEKIDLEKKAKYKGILNMNDENNYSILERYDLMLFPTYWKTEGFPGTIIDSFIASVPVLASNWNYNSEIIQEGKTGFLFKAKDQIDFNEKIKYILENFYILKDMKKNCNIESKKYHYKNVLDQKILKILR